MTIVWIALLGFALWVGLIIFLSAIEQRMSPWRDE